MQHPLSLAPMEGITTFVFRNAFMKYYGGVDICYSPFISATRNKNLSTKELRDILPENNTLVPLVPQVLCNNADDFMHTAEQIKALGYHEINLNFGCPSGTVTAKGKGAGILKDELNLERLLDEIFRKTDMEISVKTRVGFTFYSEWEDLMKIYKKYPLKELIIHGRVREDFYKGKANWECVREALSYFEGKFPITYNGDVFQTETAKELLTQMPTIYGIMMGRGLITNPALASEINGSEEIGAVQEKERFIAFHKEILDGYAAFLSGDRNVLFKIKELWPYMCNNMENGQKLLKMICKCDSLSAYERILTSGLL